MHAEEGLDQKVGKMLEEINAQQKVICEGLEQLPKAGRRLILIGKTGIGKSTLSNYLTGEQLTVQLKKGSLILEGGRGIGNTHGSCTGIPGFFANQGPEPLTIIDCPGFEDTGGSAAQVKNAFYIRTLFNGFAEKANGVDNFTIGLVVNAAGFEVLGRGGVFRQTIKAAIQLIGDPEEINGHIVLFVTGVSPYKEADHIREDIRGIITSIVEGEEKSDLTASEIKEKKLIEILAGNSDIFLFRAPINYDKAKEVNLYQSTLRNEFIKRFKQLPLLKSLQVNISVTDEVRVEMLELAQRLRAAILDSEEGIIDRALKQFNSEISPSEDPLTEAVSDVLLKNCRSIREKLLTLRSSIPDTDRSVASLLEPVEASQEENLRVMRDICQFFENFVPPLNEDFSSSVVTLERDLQNLKHCGDIYSGSISPIDYSRIREKVSLFESAIGSAEIPLLTHKFSFLNSQFEALVEQFYSAVIDPAYFNAYSLEMTINIYQELLQTDFRLRGARSGTSAAIRLQNFRALLTDCLEPLGRERVANAEAVLEPITGMKNLMDELVELVNHYHETLREGMPYESCVGLFRQKFSEVLNGFQEKVKDRVREDVERVYTITQEIIKLVKNEYTNPDQPSDDMLERVDVLRDLYHFFERADSEYNAYQNTRESAAQGVSIVMEGVTVDPGTLNREAGLINLGYIFQILSELDGASLVSSSKFSELLVEMRDKVHVVLQLVLDENSNIPEQILNVHNVDNVVHAVLGQREILHGEYQTAAMRYIRHYETQMSLMRPSFWGGYRREVVENPSIGVFHLLEIRENFENIVFDQGSSLDVVRSFHVQVSRMSDFFNQPLLMRLIDLYEQMDDFLQTNSSLSRTDTQFLPEQISGMVRDIEDARENLQRLVRERINDHVRSETDGIRRARVSFWDDYKRKVIDRSPIDFSILSEAIDFFNQIDCDQQVEEVLNGFISLVKERCSFLSQPLLNQVILKYQNTIDFCRENSASVSDDLRASLSSELSSLIDDIRDTRERLIDFSRTEANNYIKSESSAISRLRESFWRYYDNAMTGNRGIGYEAALRVRRVFNAVNLEPRRQSPITVLNHFKEAVSGSDHFFDSAQLASIIHAYQVLIDFCDNNSVIFQVQVPSLLGEEMVEEIVTKQAALSEILITKAREKVTRVKGQIESLRQSFWSYYRENVIRRSPIDFSILLSVIGIFNKIDFNKTPELVVCDFRKLIKAQDSLFDQRPLSEILKNYQAIMKFCRENTEVVPDDSEDSLLSKLNGLVGEIRDARTEISDFSIKKAEAHIKSEEETISRLRKTFWKGYRRKVNSNMSHDDLLTAISFFRGINFSRRADSKLLHKFCQAITKQEGFLDPSGLSEMISSHERLRRFLETNASLIQAQTGQQVDVMGEMASEIEEARKETEALLRKRADADVTSRQKAIKLKRESFWSDYDVQLSRNKENDDALLSVSRIFNNVNQRGEAPEIVQSFYSETEKTSSFLDLGKLAQVVELYSDDIRSFNSRWGLCPDARAPLSQEMVCMASDIMKYREDLVELVGVRANAVLLNIEAEINQFWSSVERYKRLNPIKAKLFLIHLSNNINVKNLWTIREVADSYAREHETKQLDLLAFKRMEEKKEQYETTCNANPLLPAPEEGLQEIESGFKLKLSNEISNYRYRGLSDSLVDYYARQFAPLERLPDPNAASQGETLGVREQTLRSQFHNSQEEYQEAIKYQARRVGFLALFSGGVGGILLFFAIANSSSANQNERDDFKLAGGALLGFASFCFLALMADCVYNPSTAPCTTTFLGWPARFFDPDHYPLYKRSEVKAVRDEMAQLAEGEIELSMP